MTLTSDTYVAIGGIRCPNCNSENIDGGSVDIDAGYAGQKCSCTDCNAHWTDSYQLVGYINLDPPATIPDFGLTAQQLDDKYNPNGNGEHPEYTRELWRHEVFESNTVRGYWDWVVAEIEAKENEQ